MTILLHPDCIVQPRRPERAQRALAGHVQHREDRSSFICCKRRGRNRTSDQADALRHIRPRHT